ncbi:MAG: tetratricopeptide repeat protein [Candidatus Zixiibacteriota bacterium]
MKIYKYSLIFALVIIMAMPAFAQKRGAKKEPNALMSSARIALLANPPRYDEAMGLCNEVLADNGPIPEAYFRRAIIYGEYASEEYDPNKKLDFIKLMAADFDSLHYSCDNKDLNIKKKYLKDCKDFVDQIDSLKVYFWRDNYNDALEMLTKIDDIYLPGFKNAADSSEKEIARGKLMLACDSTKNYFNCAYASDPIDYRPIEGIGVVYDRLKQYDTSAIWFEKAHQMVPDSTNIIQNIAYAYIRLKDWDNSIVWFQKLLEKIPDEVNIIANIAICYNNKGMYDSAYAYNMKAIAIDTTSADTYVDIGQYFLLMSQQYSDSAKMGQEANDIKASDKYEALRDQNLDSSAYYYGKAIQFDDSNILALSQYGVVVMIRSMFDEAISAFTKLTELEPYKKGHWLNLGDALIKVGKFSEAIPPFEKASELDPGDIRILQTLSDLYASNKMPEKAKQAKAKMEELQKM